MQHPFFNDFLCITADGEVLQDIAEDEAEDTKDWPGQGSFVGATGISCARSGLRKGGRTTSFQMRLDCCAKPQLCSAQAGRPMGKDHPFILQFKKSLEVGPEEERIQQYSSLFQ